MVFGRGERRPRKSPKLLGRIVMYLTTLLVHAMRFLLPASHRIHVEKISIKHEKASKFPSKKLRVVHLSDIHHDEPPFVPRILHEQLDEVVELSNSFDADLILITGDFVQWGANPARELVQRWLKNLKARHGIYAVTGNHDYKEGIPGRDFIISELQAGGIKVLMNQHEVICDGEVEIVGLGDYYYKPDFRPDIAFHGTKDDRYRIVMSHNPDTAEPLRRYKVDLQLSGHTHGGQIKMPFGLGPALPHVEAFTNKLPVRVQNWIPGRHHFRVVKKWLWSEGFHRIPRLDESGKELDSFNYLYTNRGLATHPPMRLFCPPEITVIDIEHHEN